MKSSRISLLAAALALMCSCASMRETPVESSSLPHYKWTKIADGMDYTQIAGDIFKSNQCISAVRYRTAKYRTDVVSATGKEAMTTSGFGQKYNALAAINGSYFNVSKLTPVTYIKEDGTQLGYTTAGEMIRTDGIAMFDGCSIAINLSDTSRYTSLAASYEDALASGPVLITNGKVRTDWPSTSFFTGRHPRTVFGTDGKGYACRYDAPRTPYERLLSEKVLPTDEENALKAYRSKLHPIELRHRLEKRLQRIMRRQEAYSTAKKEHDKMFLERALPDSALRAAPSGSSVRDTLQVGGVSLKPKPISQRKKRLLGTQQLKNRKAPAYLSGTHSI